MQRSPRIGVKREALATGLRVLFFGDYGIYYTLQEGALVVVRVLHGARDIDALADRGGFTAT